MTHTFYIQNASRRSAQAFPITLAPGVKFSDAKADFASMLGTPAEQIIRLTTADGHIILPGQEVPNETLLLEVERRAFDKLTGAGTFAPLEGFWSTRTFFNAIFPALVVFVMFSGYTIILGALASASEMCSKEAADAVFITTMFAWGPANPNNIEFSCGMSISLFWWIISAELVLVIFPAIILLFWAGSFNADTKGSWAYIITCTLNIVTALLCFEAFVAVPGAYFTDKSNNASGKAEATMKAMAAGLIIILVGNFFWIICQAFGKMIPDAYQCCECWSSISQPGAPASIPATGVVSSNSPLATPTKQPGVVVATA